MAPHAPASHSPQPNTATHRLNPILRPNSNSNNRIPLATILWGAQHRPQRP
jgi:hypothetical protein